MRIVGERKAQHRYSSQFCHTLCIRSESFVKQSSTFVLMPVLVTHAAVTSAVPTIPERVVKRTGDRPTDRMDAG